MRILSIASAAAAAAVLAPGAAAAAAAAASNMTWHVVWIGGQSNSVGTNSDTVAHPVWPTTDSIQMFCWNAQHGCTTGSFAPAQVPVYGESNVGFSQTYANLLLQALPPNSGVVLVNTGVGGTGFQDGQWVVPNGPLAVQSVAAVTALHAAFPAAFPGSRYSFHSMLWHQGEEDAGDNRVGFQAPYCTYLVDDLSALVDFMRGSFPGASATTPFIDGGLLPYWEDAVNGTQGVSAAISALNSSRVCTGTADSRIFPDFMPDGTPNGDPKYRSGASGDVIHFTATQQFFFGFQFWGAYMRAVALTRAVSNAQTSACPGSVIQAPVAACGS